MSSKFEALVEKYHRLVMHLISQYYGGALRHEADDLSQEIWTKLWEQFKKNEKNIVNFKSYLYRTVQTTLWDAVRKTDRQPSTNLEEDELGEINSYDRHRIQEDQFLARNQLEVLMGGLKKEEQLIVKSYLKGFNSYETASLLGVSEGRVRNLFTRIKKKMARSYHASESRRI